ncbi:MAG: CerR family C-terminal domain-containing protein [Gemmatimonadaceae bacterium]|nr:CerR family C-terminal domain-containing protein [Gemmatimonadaceae bacterium]
MGRGGEHERHRRDAEETKRRLLETARRLFGERGYAQVTIRDIVREARVNLAAVSYHFRDKLGLYMDVVKAALEVARAFNEETMRAPPGSSAEERLRCYIRAYLPLVVRADQKGWFHQLMRHEMAAPTPALDWMVQEAIMPRIEYLAQIVTELLGPAATEARVRRCVTSIQAECLFYAPHPFKIAAFGDWLPRTDEAIRETADHIVAFTLAGIRAIAEEAGR